jgi:uncharacterized membrane-anchored protein YjiN (DUF445 family)
MISESFEKATQAISETATASVRARHKQSQLARMQRIATGMLGAALVVLLLSARYESVWPWLRWARAFAEASAIGAIADWYAVVALFRRPLGLPIPHTAIIPENKESIGESLGEFVAQHLLTPENIVGKLERYDMARQVAKWLALPANAARVAAALVSAAPGLLRAPDDADIRRFFGDHITPMLLDFNLARWASKAMKLVVDVGMHRTALAAGLKLLDRWLIANEETIRTKFAQASRYTPAAFDAYIVRKFMEGIRGLVHDVAADPAHPIRGQVEVALGELIRLLDESPAYRDAARNWTRHLLEHWERDEDFRRLRDAIASHVEADLAREESVLRRSAAVTVIGVAQGILQDQAVLDRLNGAWLKFARALTLRYRGQISTLIADVLKSWDADEVSRKIALEIGKDLQFIRINGALVGGMVGVVLHACTVAVV